MVAAALDESRESLYPIHADAVETCSGLEFSQSGAEGFGIAAEDYLIPGPGTVVFPGAVFAAV